MSTNLEKNYRSLQSQLNRCRLRNKHLQQMGRILMGMVIVLFLLDLWEALRVLL